MALLNEIAEGQVINPILPEKRLDCSFYLANERIFLKWARTVIFLSTAGFTFLQRGFSYFGYTALILSLIISGYSGVTFWLRKNAFVSKKAFYEPIGLSVIIGSIFPVVKFKYFPDLSLFQSEGVIS